MIQAFAGDGLGNRTPFTTKECVSYSALSRRLMAEIVLRGVADISRFPSLESGNKCTPINHYKRRPGIYYLTTSCSSRFDIFDILMTYLYL